MVIDGVTPLVRHDQRDNRVERPTFRCNLLGSSQRATFRSSTDTTKPKGEIHVCLFADTIFTKITS